MKKKLFYTLLFLIVIAIASIFVYSARLPNVNGDNNVWGDVLNAFLNVSHDQNGSLVKGINFTALNINLTGTLNSTGTNWFSSVIKIDSTGICFGSDCRNSWVSYNKTDVYNRTETYNKTEVYNRTELYNQSQLYQKTEIDTQGEVETIWGVTLATDAEIAGFFENDGLTNGTLATAIDNTSIVRNKSNIYNITALNASYASDSSQLGGNSASAYLLISNLVTAIANSTIVRLETIATNIANTTIVRSETLINDISNSTIVRNETIATAIDNSSIVRLKNGGINLTSIKADQINISSTDGSGINEPRLNVNSINNDSSAIWVTGNESDTGTIKASHNYPGGDDSSASGLSIQLRGDGTAAQGIVIDSGNSTGNTLLLKNSTATQVSIGADGATTINSNNPNALLVQDIAGNDMLRVQASSSVIWVRKLIPVSTGIYDLGDATHIWDDFWADGIFSDGTSGFTIPQLLDNTTYDGRYYTQTQVNAQHTTMNSTILKNNTDIRPANLNVTGTASFNSGLNVTDGTVTYTLRVESGSFIIRLT